MTTTTLVRNIERKTEQSRLKFRDIYFKNPGSLRNILLCHTVIIVLHMRRSCSDNMDFRKRNIFVEIDKTMLRCLYINRLTITIFCVGCIVTGSTERCIHIRYALCINDTRFEYEWEVRQHSTMCKTMWILLRKLYSQ